MNGEFHYWITLFAAKRAGVPDAEARIIAYSSQLTDDRTARVELEGPGSRTLLIATQSFAYSDDPATRAARMAFHFVPGDAEAASALRVDGRASRLATTPGCKSARAALVAALSSRDPYAVGIAAHAYADTWAHANFSGVEEAANSFSADDPIPPLGHAAALKKPDLLNEVWEDPRLVARERSIDNRKRFAGAARMLYKFFAAYSRRGFDDVDRFEAELRELWGGRGAKMKEERLADYAIATGERPYDKDEWFVEAGLQGLVATLRVDGSAGPLERRLKDLARKGRDMLVDKLGLSLPEPAPFADSHLRRWNEAACRHLCAAQAAFRESFSDIFAHSP